MRFSFKIRFISRFFFIVLILTFFIPYLVKAESIYAAHTRVEIISPNTVVMSGERFWVGLKMSMDQGWHVYWHNPGDSGFAPKLTWVQSEDYLPGQMQWPFPHLIAIPPLTSYGYEKEVFLPVEMEVSSHLKVGNSLLLKAHVDWLACEVECVPGQADLTLSVPVGQESLMNKDVESLFVKTFSKIPQENPFQTEAFDLGESLRFRIESSKNIQPQIFFPNHNKLINHSDVQSWSKTGQYYQLDLEKSSLWEDGLIKQVEGIITVKNKQDDSIHSYIFSAPLKIGKEDGSRMSGAAVVNSLFIAVVFAFIGGVILNFMPCVLPVLSIKILNLIEEAGKNQKDLLKQGIVFAGGIISAFWVLGAGTILLKWAGHQIGWGFQFQSPIFVVCMSILFLGLALNLFGVFEFAVSLTRLSNTKLQELKMSCRRSFFNGVLTTIVATPCTAPFMGSAMGYSLSKPPIYSFFIFTFLGIGLSLPYLIFSLNPKLLKFFPKPGSWMKALKECFGFIFLAVVIWLSSILGSQRGLEAVIYLYGGLLLISISVWIYGRWSGLNHPFSIRRRSVCIAFVIFLLGVFIALKTVRSENSVIQRKESIDVNKIQWQNFSRELLDQNLTEGHPVFLDFTAAWCLTCKVNELVTFNNEEVIRLFKANKILAIKADWTNYDPEITRLLEEFGKNSIPLYVYYPRGKKDKQSILPELITPKIIKEYLK
ncbi:MAG: thioredoxin family protein [Candidatus Omnitrophica bacterium]|nr:thioredoxin family protein [Candidatus Omnitrophota bacterium]